MKKFTIALLVVLLVAVAVWLTQCQEEQPAEQAPVEQATVEQPPAEEKPVELTPAEKTLAMLKNATYMGIQEKDPVTLTDGLWVGEPSQEGGSSRPKVYYVRDFLLEGDIDGNGTDEAAVLLAASSGGTGVNIYLAAVRITDDKRVSRHHFLLEISPPTVRLRDLGSLNGTNVNGVRPDHGRQAGESRHGAGR